MRTVKNKSSNPLPKLLENEEMRDVVGYEQYLMVSNLGNVYRKQRYWITGRNTTRCFKGGFISPSVGRCGYLRVALRLGGKTKNLYVHRMVMEAFVGVDKKFQVNHINGLKYDNRLVNLEYLTASENQKHAYRIGIKVSTDKMEKPMIQMDISGLIVNRWKSLALIHKHGFNRSAVIRCAKGRQKTSYGYKWEYEKEK